MNNFTLPLDHQQPSLPTTPELLDSDILTNNLSVSSAFGTCRKCRRELLIGLVYGTLIKLVTYLVQSQTTLSSKSGFFNDAYVNCHKTSSSRFWSKRSISKSFISSSLHPNIQFRLNPLPIGCFSVRKHMHCNSKHHNRHLILSKHNWFTRRILSKRSLSHKRSSFFQTNFPSCSRSDSTSNESFTIQPNIDGPKTAWHLRHHLTMLRSLDRLTLSHYKSIWTAWGDENVRLYAVHNGTTKVVDESKEGHYKIHANSISYPYQRPLLPSSHHHHHHHHHHRHRYQHCHSLGPTHRYNTKPFVPTPVPKIETPPTPTPVVDSSTLSYKNWSKAFKTSLHQFLTTFHAPNGHSNNKETTGPPPTTARRHSTSSENDNTFLKAWKWQDWFSGERSTVTTGPDVDTCTQCGVWMNNFCKCHCSLQRECFPCSWSRLRHQLHVEDHHLKAIYNEWEENSELEDNGKKLKLTPSQLNENDILIKHNNKINNHLEEKKERRIFHKNSSTTHTTTSKPKPYLCRSRSLPNLLQSSFFVPSFSSSFISTAENDSPCDYDTLLLHCINNILNHDNKKKENDTTNDDYYYTSNDIHKNINSTSSSSPIMKQLHAGSSSNDTTTTDNNNSLRTINKEKTEYTAKAQHIRRFLQAFTSVKEPEERKVKIAIAVSQLVPLFVRLLPPTHYITMFHGLNGTARDLGRFKNVLLQKNMDLHCYVPDCYAVRAMTGVASLTLILKEYLLKETQSCWGTPRLPATPDLLKHLLVPHKEKDPVLYTSDDGRFISLNENSIVWSHLFLSFVGHSLGGVLARSLVALNELQLHRDPPTYNNDVYNKFTYYKTDTLLQTNKTENRSMSQLMNFATFASPHNGIFEDFVAVQAMSFLLPTGRDLMTTSAELMRLASIPAVLPLTKFNNLVLYGNVANDFLVGPYTSLLLDSDIVESDKKKAPPLFDDLLPRRASFIRLDSTTNNNIFEGLISRFSAGNIISSLSTTTTLEFPKCSRSVCLKCAQRPVEIDMHGKVVENVFLNDTTNNHTTTNGQKNSRKKKSVLFGDIKLPTIKRTSLGDVPEATRTKDSQNNTNTTIAECNIIDAVVNNPPNNYNNIHNTLPIIPDDDDDDDKVHINLESFLRLSPPSSQHPFNIDTQQQYIPSLPVENFITENEKSENHMMNMLWKCQSNHEVWKDPSSSSSSSCDNGNSPISSFSSFSSIPDAAANNDEFITPRSAYTRSICEDSLPSERNLPSLESNTLASSPNFLFNVRYLSRLPWRRFGVYIPSPLKAHNCIIWHTRIDTWNLGRPIVTHYADEAFLHP